MGEIKEFDNTLYCTRCEELALIHCWGQIFSNFGGQLVISTNFKMHISFDPAVPLIGVYST